MPRETLQQRSARYVHLTDEQGSSLVDGVTVGNVLQQYNRAVGWDPDGSNVRRTSQPLPANDCWYPKISKRSLFGVSGKGEGIVTSRMQLRKPRTRSHYVIRGKLRLKNFTHVLAWLCLDEPPVGTGHAGHLCCNSKCWNPRHIMWCSKKENDAMTMLYSHRKCLKLRLQSPIWPLAGANVLSTFKQFVAGTLPQHLQHPFTAAVNAAAPMHANQRGDPRPWMGLHWASNVAAFGEMYAVLQVLARPEFALT
jgi:hypothetical protein